MNLQVLVPCPGSKETLWPLPLNQPVRPCPRELRRCVRAPATPSCGAVSIRLTGIVPVGLFLLEHFLSNSEAIHGVAAYNAQVKFLTGLPFRLGLEIFGIFIPLVFHALYGVYIWWRGENNVIDYPWTGNWFYTLQRYTGLIVFAYVTFHLWSMRFTGVHLTEHADASFWKVQHELSNPLALAFYVVGIVAASWHFGYGLFLFAAKWGIVTGDKARKRAQGAGIALSVLLVAGRADVDLRLRSQVPNPAA